MFEFIKNLASAPNDKILVLTPNRRLAQYLSQQFDLYNQNNLGKFWQKPKIQVFYSWLENFWLEFQDNKQILLNESQEFILWKKIINESAVATDFFINNVKDAFDILQQWQIDLSELKKYSYAEVIKFQNWATKFINLTKNYLLSSTLTNNITKKIQENALSSITIPNNIILIGFDDFTLTPKDQNLLQILENRGCKIEKLNFKVPNEILLQTEFNNEEQEIIAMALWAQKRLLENPKARIGCVVPNLTELRSDIERIFTEIFAPKAFLTNNYHQTPFNISIGRNLSEFPIINTALKIINTTLITDFENILYLLQSPYIVEVLSEKAGRNLFAIKLQNFSFAKINLNEFYKTNKKDLNLCPVFCEILQKHINSFKNLAKSQSHSAWAAFFWQQLQNFGFAPTNLNSEEFQALKRFEKIFAEYISLDLISNNISHETALQHLNYLTHKTIFQRQKENTTINILGIFETAGMNFDHLWIMGMNNKSWPTIAKPNQFIPFELQKKYATPHSSATHELKICQMLTTRFCQSANEVIFSFSNEKAGEKHQASTLINSLPKKSFPMENPDVHSPNADKFLSPLVLQIFTNKKLEPVLENNLLPLETNENITANGDLFKLQSQCPFRAFAKYRLKAKSFQESTTSVLRGKIIHKILEQIWKKFTSHKKLFALSLSEFEIEINTIITDSIDTIKNSENILPPKNFIPLETKCLKTIIYKWLEFEKNRKPFEVFALESEINTKIKNLAVKLRFDRIDLLNEKNTAIIIDYKTGNKIPESNDWTLSRPDDPQLPLYYVAINKAENFINANIEGLVFANLNTAKLNTAKKKFLHGKAKSPELISDKAFTKIEVEDHWQDVSQKWQEIIENLANDFCAGVVKVDPLNNKETCKHCEFGALCRKQLD